MTSPSKMLLGSVLACIATATIVGAAAGAGVDPFDGDLSDEFVRKVIDPSAYTLDFADVRADADPEGVKSQCGVTRDYEDVRRLKLHKVHQAAVDATSPRVGALAIAKYNLIYCSGVLLTDSLFLTASHCVDAGNHWSKIAVFRYELTVDGQPAEIVSREVVGVVADGADHKLDYAVLQIAPLGTDKIESLRVARIGVGDTVGVIQHPSGKGAQKFKKVDFGNVAHAGSSVRYNSLDTARSSSGGAVIDSDGALVAIHTTAGCTLLGGTNVGLPIDVIRADLDARDTAEAHAAAGALR